MFDEDLSINPKDKVLDLEILSIEELQERIINLKHEITRCETAISKKKSSLSAANAFFGNMDK